MRAKDVDWANHLAFFGCALLGAVAAWAADPPALGLPHVSVVAGDPLALEGVSTAAFTVMRSGDTSSPLQVDYTLRGTASNGLDYVRLPGFVTIPAGWVAANVLVQPMNNGRLDPNKTVVLTLVSDAAYLLESPRGAIVRILDNRFLGALPGVTLISPTNGAVLDVPPYIVLTATVTNTGDAIREVAFYADAQLLHSFTNAPYSWTWTNMTGGSHVLTAVVTDQSGATNESKPVSIRVIRVPPAVKWITPTNGARIYLPAAIPLAVQVINDYGQIASVGFYVGGHLIGSVTKPPYSLVWSNPALDVPTLEKHSGTGSLAVLEARVTDFSGQIGRASEEIWLLTNQPPTVRIVSPQDITTFRSPSTFLVEISASDPDDTVSRIELFANGISLAIFTNAVPTQIYQWRNVRPGNYTLTATAADARGLISTSPPVRLLYSTAMMLPEIEGTVSAQAVVSKLKPPMITLGQVQPGVRPNVTVEGYRVSFGRGYAEFMIPTLPGGLLNATLVVQRLSNQGSAKVDLSSYLADLAVTTNDFSDVASPLAAFSVISNPEETFTVDLTELVQQFAGGNLGFQFKVADEFGLAPTNSAAEAAVFSDVRILLASRTNLPPAVRILSPTMNAVFPPTTNIMIAVEAKDADGLVKSVELFAGATLLGTARTQSSLATFRVIWTDPPSGSYDLTALATDDGNASATSSPVHITISAVLPQKASTGAAAGGAALSLPAAASVPASGSTAAASPVVQSMTTLPDGTVQLTITGPPGDRIAVEASPNFADWTRLAVITNTTGTVRYLDIQATTASRRFYRVKLAD